jgi:hypothetical protein
MNNYFNAQTRTNHIILLAMQYTLEDMALNKALTPEEQKWLKTACTYLKKFNSAVFERLGEPYKRKILGTMQINDLRLVPNYNQKEDCISYCATEDIMPKVSELQFFHCMECNKQDYLNCAVYALSISCDVTPQQNNLCSTCPFKID